MVDDTEQSQTEMGVTDRECLAVIEVIKHFRVY